MRVARQNIASDRLLVDLILLGHALAIRVTANSHNFDIVMFVHVLWVLLLFVASSAYNRAYMHYSVMTGLLPFQQNILKCRLDVLMRNANKSQQARLADG